LIRRRSHPEEDVCMAQGPRMDRLQHEECSAGIADRPRLLYVQMAHALKKKVCR